LEDRELLAAIGQAVVTAAALEYAVAVLVALTEGHQDQACEDRALSIVKGPGGAMRELRKLACAHLRGEGMSERLIAEWLLGSRRLTETGKPLPDHADISEKTVRKDLALWDRAHAGAVPLLQFDVIHLWRDARAVLHDRHVIAHSIALEKVEAGGQGGLVILDARNGAEMTLTTAVALGLVQDIRITYRRFYKAIAAESSRGS